jgi:hypothetical protein
MGIAPSQRAARRNGALLLGQCPATQIGMRGCWTGGGGGRKVVAFTV